jgi:SOS-response transcriptional repressor LexA
MIQRVLPTSIPRVSRNPLSSDSMRQIKAERLRAAREKSGFGSAADAARTFGWMEAAYRHHENGTRGFGPDAAKKYGRAFKVKPGWLLGLDNVDGAPPTPPDEDDRLVVNGSVEAGAWRASEEWNDERSFAIEGMPSPVPGARRFGLIVVGRSMDEFYEPDTVLDCVSIFDTDVRPQTGDHVIVEAHRADGLRELTVKEYREEDGRYWLVPRSTRPGFEPVEYPGPDKAHIGEGEIRVIAFVVGNTPPRVLDLLRRMGRVKPI